MYMMYPEHVNKLKERLPDNDTTNRHNGVQPIDDTRGGNFTDRVVWPEVDGLLASI